MKPTDAEIVRMAIDLYKVFWGEAPTQMQDVHWLAVARRAIELGASLTPQLTKPQEQLLGIIGMRQSRGRGLHRHDVAVARRLEALGLVTLEDNGRLRAGPGGTDDGERWVCTLTPSGRAVLESRG